MATKQMTKQKALTEKLTVRFDALPEAWIQNELFEQTKDYLTRGRRFERLRVDQLNEEWAKAFRQFVKRQAGPHGRDLDDAGAELRLRSTEFPTYLVMQEVEMLKSFIRHIGSVAPSAEFLRKLDEIVSNLSCNGSVNPH
jgi:hypothetical protein